MNPVRLLQIALADFLVRSAYQMGKTPLLPIFAAALGASDVLLGAIVSVSTLTGMVTKPLFGFLSDRTGRRVWMLIGVALFAGIPFLYRFITTPGHLVALRLVHGTATAIFGPVTVAYVAEHSPTRKAEALGWFSMARSGGYIIGPALGGWLLLWMRPVDVFALIGLISSLAFLPVLLLDEAPRPALPGPTAPGLGPLRRAPWRDLASPIRETAAQVFRAPAIWLSGGLEGIVYIATYALKAFLPLYALVVGFNTAQIGLFFSLQELSQILLKPAGGHLGDRWGHLRAVAVGMAMLALPFPLLLWSRHAAVLLGLAILMGAAQAVVFPATLALIAQQVRQDRLATGVGLAGALKNAGKVVGPVLGGVLVAWVGYQGMLWLLAGVLTLGAAGIGVVGRLKNEERELRIGESV